MLYDPSRLYVTAMATSLWKKWEIEEKLEDIHLFSN